MQIVVPMSGFGERFRKAGYKVPKPLIEVDGKPIIAHVIDLFPGESDFTFICNREHLANPEFAMREILNTYCPTGRIVEIEPHRKGPVYAVTKVLDQLASSEPTVINYCDFTCDWDYNNFKQFVLETGCDGCVPAYRGFHPHMLGTTNYAFIKDQGGRLLDIQEKKPFTSNRMQEFASSGTYYFRSADLIRQYFKRCMDDGLDVNGEYYVSMVYRPMAQDGRLVTVYELDHFMQWGTPHDLEEYKYWSGQFRRSVVPSSRFERKWPGTLLLPMAGAGSRFTAAGYQLPKPLIDVSGRPMVVQAVRDLPPMAKQTFVLRKDLPHLEEIKSALRLEFPMSECVVLDAITDGQARTCMLGLAGVDLDQPLTIGACDNGALYNAKVFERLLSDPEVDLIVWAARGYPGARKNPNGYGWLKTDGDNVLAASVKVPLEDPSSDAVIIGTFTFRRAFDFKRAAEHLFAHGPRVNQEFYVDSCINSALALGLRVKVFEVEYYLCWGTPEDLESYRYWQRCFSKWSSHPYSVSADPDVTSQFAQQVIASSAQAPTQTFQGHALKGCANF